MHFLQSKHIKLSEKESEELLKKLNVSKSQLPRIFLDDPAMPQGCQVGDILRIERKEGDKVHLYFRVVV